ncbi:MAG: hypothetical protein FWG31_09340 [Oscillospiraceae bacterium]|nr:hypothetical protein [Oscillospiraceae bacterium]
MKTNIRKRLAALALSAVMLLGFGAGFSESGVPAAYASGADKLGFDIGINLEVTNDALGEEIVNALRDVLEQKGFGNRAIAGMMAGFETAEGSTPGNHSEGGDSSAHVDAVDFSKWVVYDHYDSGFFYNSPGTNVNNNINSSGSTTFSPGSSPYTTGNLANHRFNPNVTIGGSVWRTGIDWRAMFDNATGLNLSGVNGLGNINNLRPYFPHVQKASNVAINPITTANVNAAYLNPTGGTTSINGTHSNLNATYQLPRIALEDWLNLGTKPTSGHTLNEPTLGAFDRHILSRMMYEAPNGDFIPVVENIAGEKPADGAEYKAQFGTDTYRKDQVKPTMDFVGYANSNFLDFAFYPVDTDAGMIKKEVQDADGNVDRTMNLVEENKLVSFDVDASRVNPHTLYGAGFMINTGIDASGKISGYVLMYEYPSGTAFNAENPEPPTKLALYRIRDDATGITAQAFHDHNQGITANNGNPALGTLFTSTTPLAQFALNSSNWWKKMSVELVIEPQTNGTTDLKVYQVEKGTKILHHDSEEKMGTDDYGLPTGFQIKKGEIAETVLTPILTYNLPNTGAKKVDFDVDAAGNVVQKTGSISKSFNGFGPIVSYRSHGCNRASQFTFSNLDMIILGSALAVNTEGESFTLTEDNLYERLKMYYEGGYKPKLTGDYLTPCTHGECADCKWIDVDGKERYFEKEEVKPAYLGDADSVKYYIDIVDKNHEDRMNPSDPVFKEVQKYLTDNNINYITIRENALLADGELPGAAVNGIPVGGDEAEGFNGKTVIGNIDKIASLLRDIAEQILKGMEDCVDGINYRGDDIIVFGFKYGSENAEQYYKQLADYENNVTGAEFPVDLEPDDFWINLTQETIQIPASYAPAAYSLDEGKKWKKAKGDTFSAKKFPKLLNKGMTLYLADEWIDKDVKETDDKGKKVVVQKKGVPQGENGYLCNVITFRTINKRPTLDKFAINYAVYADPTGVTPGEWCLTTKADQAKPLAGQTKSSAFKDGWEIALASDDKKTPGQYGVFCQEDGIPVKKLEGDKPAKTVYFVKKAPEYKVIGSVVTYTASSKAKKVSALSESKPTKYKIKAKPAKMKIDKTTSEEVVVKPAEEMIKLKANDNIFSGVPSSLNDGKQVADDKLMPAQQSGTTASLKEKLSLWIISSQKGSTVDLIELDGSITVWKSASGKRPATAKQEISR